MGQKPSGFSSSSGFNPQGNVNTGSSFSFNNNLSSTPQQGQQQQSNFSCNTTTPQSTQQNSFFRLGNNQVKPLTTTTSFSSLDTRQPNQTNQFSTSQPNLQSGGSSFNFTQPNQQQQSTGFPSTFNATPKQFNQTNNSFILDEPSEIKVITKSFEPYKIQRL